MVHDFKRIKPNAGRICNPCCCWKQFYTYTTNAASLIDWGTDYKSAPARGEIKPSIEENYTNLF